MTGDTTTPPEKDLDTFWPALLSAGIVADIGSPFLSSFIPSRFFAFWELSAFSAFVVGTVFVTRNLVTGLGGTPLPPGKLPASR